MEDQQKGINIIHKITLLTNWFPNLLETQIDFIANTLSSIFIPSSFKSPPLSNSTLDDSGSGSGRVQTLNMARKVGQGLLGAVYAGTVLSLMMFLSILLGVLLVNYWVEHPVVIREKLYFDYTDVNPEAMFVFRGRKDGKLHGGYNGVPVGHSFHVCVQFVFPDSDYNRDVGVYQLMAEVVSTNGKVIARSSQPSMLEFHSYPIRLMHTFIMSFPILLGLSRETQKMKVQMLRYKEDNNLRTEAIKITLMPRAGFPYLLPQIYEAEIIMHSKLPRLKELIHDWKWTFYVWTSLYFYIMLLLLLFCFFRSLLLFPIVRASDHLEGDGREADAIRDESSEVRMQEGKEFSETLRKWQQYRRKRKAALLSKSAFSEIVGSTSASSYTLINEDPGPALEEHVGDSECSFGRPLW